MTKQATITNLMQLIEQHVPKEHHDMIRHSIEFAYCDGKIDGIRELAKDWTANGINPTAREKIATLSAEAR